MILSGVLIWPISQLQTASDDVTIRSHTEYLIQTYHILVLILYVVEIDENSSLIRPCGF